MRERRYLALRARDLRVPAPLLDGWPARMRSAFAQVRALKRALDRELRCPETPTGERGRLKALIRLPRVTCSPGRITRGEAFGG